MTLHSSLTLSDMPLKAVQCFRFFGLIFSSFYKPHGKNLSVKCKILLSNIIKYNHDIPRLDFVVPDCPESFSVPKCTNTSRGQLSSFRFSLSYFYSDPLVSNPTHEWIACSIAQNLLYSEIHGAQSLSVRGSNWSNIYDPD